MDPYEQRVIEDVVWFLSHGCAQFGLAILRSLSAEQLAKNNALMANDTAGG